MNTSELLLPAGNKGFFFDVDGLHSKLQVLPTLAKRKKVQRVSDDVNALSYSEVYLSDPNHPDINYVLRTSFQSYDIAHPHITVPSKEWLIQSTSATGLKVTLRISDYPTDHTVSAKQDLESHSHIIEQRRYYDLYIDNPTDENSWEKLVAVTYQQKKQYDGKLSGTLYTENTHYGFLDSNLQSEAINTLDLPLLT